MPEQTRLDLRPPKEPASNAPAPLFYKNPSLLTPDRFAGKSLAPNASLRFALDTNSVPLNGVELALAQRHYPIVFSEEETPFPIAILGLRNAENSFVGADGRWAAGAYVPAYVRRYPFVFVTGADQSQFALCIDAASDFVVDGDANPFFRDGKPAEASQNALAFCSAFQGEFEKTKAFARAVAEQGLFESKTADVELKNGQKLRLGTFKTIDEGKLAALPHAVVSDWLKRGWLLWIHAHLLSASNWALLAQRITTPPAGAGEPR